VITRAQAGRVVSIGDRPDHVDGHSRHGNAHDDRGGDGVVDCLKALAPTTLEAWRSRPALRVLIGRVTARAEGALRRHMIMRDGTKRDSAVFSVMRLEWPEA